MNVVESFAVGAALHEHKFKALILKFKLQDQRLLLCGFARKQCVLLLQGVYEYLEYLQQRGVNHDSDSVEGALKSNEPELTQVEIESLASSAIVFGISAKVDQDHSLVFRFEFKSGVSEQLIIRPQYSRWLAGYVANCLNEFEEDGTPMIPEGQPN